MNSAWIKACDVDEIEWRMSFVSITKIAPSRFTALKKISITRQKIICTHGQVHLADGLVMDNIIECPKHNGQFDFISGRAKRIPACIDLQIYPVKVENEQVFIELNES